MRFSKRLMTLVLAFSLFVLPMTASAASLGSMRFHSGGDHDRVVFDLSDAADYELDTSADGRTVTLVLKGVRAKSNTQSTPSFSGSRSIGSSSSSGGFSGGGTRGGGFSGGGGGGHFGGRR